MSAEMAMVTAVTVGAFAMSMGNFSVTVERHFSQAAKSTQDDTAEEVTQDKEREEKDRREADEAKKERFRKARERQKLMSGD